MLRRNATALPVLVFRPARLEDRLGAVSCTTIGLFATHSRIGMGRNFRVDLRMLGEPFDRWCAARGKTRSAAARALVAAALEAEREPMTHSALRANVHAALRGERGNDSTPRRRRFDLRLNDDGLRRLREQSAAAGMPSAHYVAALLNTVESGYVSIAGKDAVKALIESNHQLAWMGRRLSEAAQQCHSPAAGRLEQEGEQMQELVAHLRRHLASAAAVLADVEATRCRPGSRRSRVGRRMRESE
jgi:hypothetical protein